MLRLSLKTFFVFAWIFFGLTALMPALAQAASHDLSGCLFVYDDRYDSENTKDTYVGVPDLDIEVWFKAVGIWWKAGELATSSTGCFAGTLSGGGVPANTEVEFRARMKNPKREIYLGLSAYYYQLGNDISVSSGQAANLGDYFIGNSSTPTEVLGVMTLWRTAWELRKDYQNRIGTWPSNLPRLSVEYPSSDPISNAGAKVHITEEDSKSIHVLYHESGHWLSSWDQLGWTLSAGSYCTDYTGSAYPYNLAPYSYTEPDKSNCYHTYASYEVESRAAMEGFAEFFDDFVYDGKCDQRENYPFNFDGKNNETNISAALCDLVDSDNQTVSYKHIYGQPGALEVVPLDSSLVENLFNSAFDASNLYYIDGDSIFSLPLSGATYTPSLVYSGTESKSNLAAANGHLCYQVSRDDIWCGTLNSGALTDIVTVNVAGATSSLDKIKDLVVAGDNVYTLYTDDSVGYTVTVSAVDGSAASATTVFSGCLLEGCGSAEPYYGPQLVVDESESALYLAGGRMVGACALTSSASSFVVCGNNPSTSGGLTLVAGSSSHDGFKRGAGSDTMWSSINGLSIVNNVMYVQDIYGVGTIDLNTFITAQYVGMGPSKIFNNRLHRRAIDNMGYAYNFATDGVHGYFKIFNNGNVRNDDIGDAYYHFDDSVDVTEEIYCGTDSVTLNPESVVRMYHHLGTSWSAAWDVMKNYVAGISSADLASVEGVNWLNLSSSQESRCTWAEGEEIGHAYGEVYSSSPSSKKQFTDFVNFDRPPGNSAETTVGDLKKTSSDNGSFSGERVVPKTKLINVESSQLQQPAQQ